MSIMTIRLPEDLDEQFRREAKLARKKHSQLAREVLADYVRRREDERFQAELTRAARALAGDAAAQEEARALVDETSDDGLSEVIAAERAAGIAPGKKWWK
jgi:predicted transcriptional regulator